MRTYFNRYRRACRMQHVSVYLRLLGYSTPEKNKSQPTTSPKVAVRHREAA